MPIPKQGDGIESESVYKFVSKPFAWWWALIEPVRVQYIIAFVLTAIATSMITIGATITGRFVDDVYGKGDHTKIVLYCSILIAVPVIRSLIGLVYRYIFEVSSHDLLLRLRGGLYRHLQNQDDSFYDKTSVGDIMTRMTGDLDMIRHFTAYVLMASFEQFIVFTVGTLYIFSINWILALTAIAFSPFIIILTTKFSKEIRPVWDNVRKQFSSLNAVVQQNIRGNRVVKAFVRADYETEKFETQNDGYRNIVLKSVDVWVKYIPALDGLANFLTIPVILIGGILVIKNQMTLGGLVAFNGLLFVISNPMRMVGGLVNEVQRFAASADKVIDLLMQKPDVSSIDNSIDKNQFNEEKSVEFRNVSFQYFSNKTEKDNSQNENSESLKNISFTTLKGQTTGIIGATGSGKSTLTQLIMRFHDATKGEIIINGKKVKDYSLQDLRSHIGIVMQDVFLFSDTIEGNIAYGNSDATIEDVVRAAKIARADEFIRKMPEGYDTIVGERGVGLSGGQRQRIALARALCVNPSILILDDTTSAIDMETEFEIQQGLGEFFSDKTVFVVAHRISSVRKADQILVLDKGEIAERGNHEDLLALKGIYYDVYMTQSGLLFDQENQSSESLNNQEDTYFNSLGIYPELSHNESDAITNFSQSGVEVHG